MAGSHVDRDEMEAAASAIRAALRGTSNPTELDGDGRSSRVAA